MQYSNQNHDLFQKDTALLANFAAFEQQILQLAAQMGLSLGEYEIDHLAVRVNTEESAQRWQRQLSACGQVLSQNQINGRPIYLFELAQPLQFLGQDVSIVELPYPKNKRYLQESWEHIEVVIPFLAKESTDNWIKRIENRFLWNQSARLVVKVSEPKAEGERLPNPSIAVSLKQASQNPCSIKVHPYSIRNVIEV